MEEIDPKRVVEIARKISGCDFRVTVSNYVTGDSRPWIITVGEAEWQRRLVVEKVFGEEDDRGAQFALLSPSQSGRIGYDIDVDDLDGRTTLQILTATGYTGVKGMLETPECAIF